MADGVAITAGSGTTVATDDAGGAGHVQIVKLAVSADGSASSLTADGSGLEVQLGAAIPAGTNNIGDVDVLTLPALPAGNNNIGDVDVASLPALAAGTNAIGKLSANSGVDIGDVDVTSLPSSSSATVTQVASSASNVTLKASNSARKGLTVFNDSTAALFLKFGATASATSFTVKLAAAGYWEMPPTGYTGIVDGIWAAANGNAYVTEW